MLILFHSLPFPLVLSTYTEITTTKAILGHSPSERPEEPLVSSLVGPEFATHSIAMAAWPEGEFSSISTQKAPKWLWNVHPFLCGTGSSWGLPTPWAPCVALALAAAPLRIHTAACTEPRF